ncbi:endonuclease/exonuclease/phosphatase family protein [Actinotalea sp. AC32]|nr:endonuclease/exonuclease/phosphatase family protein [Actinotalea sp. AC32]
MRATDVPTSSAPASDPTPSAPAAGGSGALRVLTYNVRQLRDDAGAVVAVLREADADVVALQEPPRLLTGRRRLRRLAADAGLTVAVAGGGARTTALLVRPGLPVHGARSMRLAWRPGRTRRGLAHATVAGVHVVSVHLGLTDAERASHLVRLLHLVRSSGASGVVVAGDLNEEPGGLVRRALALHLHDATSAAGPTFPAARPRRRIDAVLVGRGLVASGARRLDGEEARRASDHLPLLVEVRVP